MQPVVLCTPFLYVSRLLQCKAYLGAQDKTRAKEVVEILAEVNLNLRTSILVMWPKVSLLFMSTIAWSNRVMWLPCDWVYVQGLPATRWCWEGRRGTCTVDHKCLLHAEVYSNTTINLQLRFTAHNLTFTHVVCTLLQFLHIQSYGVLHLMLVHFCRFCNDSLAVWEMIISKSLFYKLNSSWLSKIIHPLYPGL